MINCITELLLVHRESIYTPFYFVKKGIKFFFGMFTFNNIGKVGKRQSGSKQDQFLGVSQNEYFLNSICVRTVEVIVKKGIGVKEYLFHLLKMYANRSSLPMSSWVIWPIPRKRLNDSGRAGSFSQSIVESLASFFMARLCDVVMRRRALMAFSNMSSSSEMMLSSRNSSAFNCSAVITSFFLISATKLQQIFD